MNLRLEALTVAGVAFFVMTRLAAAEVGILLTARPPQAWLARRFLLQMLANKSRAAYAALDPATRARLPERQFVAQAGQLRRQARRWGPSIELYKLGWRLLEGQPAVAFYQFTFTADSARSGPHVALDVTFRDSLATRPLRFSVVVERI